MGDMRAEVGTWRTKAGVRSGNERVFDSSAEGARAEVGTWRAKAKERSGKVGARSGNERFFGSSVGDVRAEVGTSCAKAEARHRKAGGTCAGVQKNRSHMRSTVRAVGYGAHSAGEGRKLSKGIG